MPPKLLSVSSGRSIGGGDCVTVKPLPATVATTVISFTSGQLRIRDRGGTPVALAVRRFGEPFLALGSSVTPHGESALSFPVDAARDTPWQLQLSSSSALSACAA
jgi:hypothetical protein